MKLLLAKFVTESVHFYNLLFSSHSLTHSLLWLSFCYLKESLNIPKESSESVSRRWIDNTIGKRTNRCLQNTTQKIKDRVTGTLLIIVG
jgi:hypothetical protein